MIFTARFSALLLAPVIALACSSTTNTTSSGTSDGAVSTGASNATSTATSTATGSGGTPTSGGATGRGTTTGAAASSGNATGSAGATSTGGSGGNGGGFDGGTRFPASSIIYQDVSNADLDPNSDAIIGSLADAGGWGTPNTHKFQIDFGLTTLYADPSVPLQSFTPSVDYESGDCDMTPVPLPPGGAAEATPDYLCDVGAGDCHILIYQGHWLFEMWEGYTPNGLWDGGLIATCEVAWDLTHDYWQPGANPYSRGDQCTSADAAGMPIAPLLATGAELQAGVVPHALRFTLPQPEITSGLYLHPGTHAGSTFGAAPLPIYTARFRLKQSFDVNSLPNAAAKAIAVALQTYGMFLDDGGNIPLTIDASASAFIGSHDLAALQVSDFEVVAAPDDAIPLTDQCQRTPLTSTN